MEGGGGNENRRPAPLLTLESHCCAAPPPSVTQLPTQKPSVKGRRWQSKLLTHAAKFISGFIRKRNGKQKLRAVGNFRCAALPR